VNGVEEESFCGGCHTGLFPVFSIEDLRDVVGRPFLSANLKEGAGDVSDHFVKKAISFKLKAKAFFFKDEVEAVEGFYRVFGAATT
jgi:hypothetical protein